MEILSLSMRLRTWNNAALWIRRFRHVVAVSVLRLLKITSKRRSKSGDNWRSRVIHRACRRKVNVVHQWGADHSNAATFTLCVTFRNLHTGSNFIKISLLSSHVISILFVILIQLRPAIPDVKGPTNFIRYWRIFVIANIGNKKKYLERPKV